MRLKAWGSSVPCDNWSLYMIECQGGGLYVGISKDVETRFLVHSKGEGAFYTKVNEPIQVLSQTVVGSHADAIKLERKVKKLSHVEKLVWVRLAKSGTEFSDLCGCFGFSNINNI